MCIFFFFKQKTAYEMRISDWSSDVCSSDLAKRWLRAKEILGALDELAPEQRAARIAAACGDDADLTAEVERLVALDDEADSYFAGLRDALGQADVAQPEQVGAYRIIREIASGRMGTVYPGQRKQDRNSG